MKKEIILLLLLLLLFIACSGCIQVTSESHSCSSGGLGVSYVERTYLWGDDGFLTKKYDATFYAFGFPQVKTGISEYELNSYKQLYCYRTASAKETMTTIPTPTPTIPRHELTDGYWCVVSDWMVSDQLKTVRDCYQFFPDGSARSGDNAYTDRILMREYEGRQWLVNKMGQYVIFTQVCSFDGYTLACPGFNPHTWSPTV